MSAEIFNHKDHAESIRNNWLPNLIGKKIVSAEIDKSEDEDGFNVLISFGRDGGVVVPAPYFHLYGSGIYKPDSGNSSVK